MNAIEAVRVGAASVLMIAGLVALGYSAFNDLAHAPTARWFDRPLVVAPVGVVLLLVGGVLGAL